MRETELDFARSVERGQVLGRELEIPRAEVVFELARVAGAEDGDDGAPLLTDPGEGNLRGAFAERTGDVADDGGDRELRLGGAALVLVDTTRVARRRGVAFALVFARQDAAAEGAPGGDGEAEGVGHRQEIALGGALNQAVFDLQRGERRPAAKIGDGVHLGDLPGGGIRDADVEDFAAADEIVERAHRLFDRREQIGGVDPVEIDVRGGEAFQARFERSHHALAMVAGRVRIARALLERVLRGEDEAIAFGGDELADETFARAFGVEVRGVDEIAAARDERVEHALAFVFAGAEAPVFAERHRAEARFGHTEAALAEQLVTEGTQIGHRGDLPSRPAGVETGGGQAGPPFETATDRLASR